MTFNPKMEDCEFIAASALFAGIEPLWTAFTESEPSCTWGGNNRSLVVARTLVTALQSHKGPLLAMFDTLQRRISELPDGGSTYVDLEN